MISCIVFAGRITEIGKPYKYDVFGTPYKTPLVANGMIMALDKQTGKKLWEFSVGSPVGVEGPSAGNGMLYVPTGSQLSKYHDFDMVSFIMPNGNMYILEPYSQ